jgi:hypothetical protein
MTTVRYKLKDGAFGYDWIVRSFKLTRQYCPKAILILNDYNTIEYGNDNTRIINIANAVKRAGAPIDAIGAQAHDAYKLPTSTVQQMHAYASGQGDIPAVVKRSGKATRDGIRYGRGEMSYFLGIAYLEGSTVPKDASQAVKWLERAATMGNRGAQAKLGAFKQ